MRCLLLLPFCLPGAIAGLLWQPLLSLLLVLAHAELSLVATALVLLWRSIPAAALLLTINRRTWPLALALPTLLVLTDAADRDRFWRATSDHVDAPDAWLAGTTTAPVVVVCLSDPGAYVERYARPDKARARPDLGPDPADASAWPVPWWDVDAGASGPGPGRRTGAALDRRLDHPRRPEIRRDPESVLAIPTLGEIGLFGFVAILLFVGLARLRRGSATA